MSADQDGKPSILDRWRKTAELPVLEPERERKAKAFTAAVMKRIKAQLDPANMRAAELKVNREHLGVAVDAAKKFLPDALREFFDLEGKRRELRQLRSEVKADGSIGAAERAAKMRVIERRIAALNQFEQGFDLFMSSGIHGIDAKKDDSEGLDKIASTFVSVWPMIREAVDYLEAEILEEGPDGVGRDVLPELTFR